MNGPPTPVKSSVEPVNMLTVRLRRKTPLLNVTRPLMLAMALPAAGPCSQPPFIFTFARFNVEPLEISGVPTMSALPAPEIVQVPLKMPAVSRLQPAAMLNCVRVRPRSDERAYQALTMPRVVERQGMFVPPARLFPKGPRCIFEVRAFGGDARA